VVTAHGLARRADAAWAGLERITLHECRHTFASIAIAAGVNIGTVSAALGHASVTITWDRYHHLMPGTMGQAAGLIQTYIEGKRMTGEIPDSIQQMAESLFSIAAELKSAADEEVDPDAKRTLEDSARDTRDLARRMIERAAIASDPAALKRWEAGLSPAERALIDQKIKDVARANDDPEK
jgi:hypothetical protein